MNQSFAAYALLALILQTGVAPAAQYRARLLSFDSAPNHVRVPQIRKFYRVPLTTCDAVMGIFSLHNQTVNVWTHLAGFLYFAYALYAAFIGRFSAAARYGSVRGRTVVSQAKITAAAAAALLYAPAARRARVQRWTRALPASLSAS